MNTTLILIRKLACLINKLKLINTIAENIILQWRKSRGGGMGEGVT